jgi:hypothetical protein
VSAERRTGTRRRTTDSLAAWVMRAALLALALVLATGALFAGGHGDAGAGWWAFGLLCAVQLLTVAVVFVAVCWQIGQPAAPGATAHPARRGPFGRVDPALVRALGAGADRRLIQARADVLFRRLVNGQVLPADRVQAFQVMRRLWTDAETEAVGEFALALVADDRGQLPAGAS